jgi:hypothetical protein
VLYLTVRSKHSPEQPVLDAFSLFFSFRSSDYPGKLNYIAVFYIQSVLLEIVISSLHDVSEMNALRAACVCLSVRPHD